MLVHLFVFDKVISNTFVLFIIIKLTKEYIKFSKQNKILHTPLHLHCYTYNI